MKQINNKMTGGDVCVHINEKITSGMLNIFFFLKKINTTLKERERERKHSPECI